MKKNIYWVGVLLIPIVLCSIFLFMNHEQKEKESERKNDSKTMKVMVLDKKDELLTIQDEHDSIYTISTNHLMANVGDYLLIEYLGVLDNLKSVQELNVLSYTALESVPSEWVEEGLFKNYYELAFQKLKKLSLDEKIGQLLLIRYNETSSLKDLNDYHVGGFVFFEKDFKNKSVEEVKTMIQTLQNKATIPLLTAVDEEGGKVVRVSSNPNLVSEKFKSSQELYTLGGYAKIKEDTLNKSKVLENLGLNLNLAPVVDVVTNSNAYMYERSFGKNTEETAKYAKTVIEASHVGNVSYALKHFPGYGNNTDTHIGSATDTRSYESILQEDIPPFQAGIEALAEAVLVSHNTVSSIDSNNPASLSSSVHNLLRNRLDFSGVIITDDLSMGATNNISDVAIKAILAGNDILITSDYARDFQAIKNAVLTQTLSEDLIDRVSLRILAWKYYKGLMSAEK